MSFKKEEATEKLAESATPTRVICKNCRQYIPNRYRCINCGKKFVL